MVGRKNFKPLILKIMKEIKTVLLINAHLTYPNWSEGKLNADFQQKAKDFFLSKNIEVLETKVENGYDIDEEVEKHLKADAVILQMPVNWFGAPWIYKKYVDEVFNKALATQVLLTGDGRTRSDVTKQYGSGGKMQGKKFMVSATWNAPQEAFSNPNQELLRGKGLDDVFLNITTSYAFCGYDIVPSYNCFDIFKNPEIEKVIEDYPKYLEENFLI